MSRRTRSHFTGAVLVLFLAAFATVLVRASGGAGQTPAKTTKDKVYSKEQAARGATLFNKTCAPCHDPAKKTADKTPGPPLVGPTSCSSRTGRTTRSARSSPPS
jgi:cytochrome c2